MHEYHTTLTLSCSCGAGLEVAYNALNYTHDIVRIITGWLLFHSSCREVVRDYREY